MKRVLFVTNGHGEAAIAERIALDLRAFVPDVRIDHLALVGSGAGAVMHEVGPRRAMPSGGLIAMGNARNLARDLRSGLLSLTWAQARFLRRARGAYDAAVAVGDVFALTMTLIARAPTVFVGSAKSVEVAPYGPGEERLLRRAAARFVRDEATARRLRERGVESEAANAIVDLFASSGATAAEPAVAGFDPVLALFPGSRESAYDDASFLLAVTRELAERYPRLGAALSISPNLDARRFANDAAGAGWDVRETSHAAVPFSLGRDGREIVRAWSGELGPLLSRAALVLGQAGTANEAAAAAGVPVAAFERDRDRKARWYRQRQRGLLGEALAVLPENLAEAVAGVRAILDDPSRRAHMGEVGRARMGSPGGASRIAARVASLLAAS
ncbi:MAG TPA: hypothetical protein VMU38_08035 [Candidatus Binatia bacterium]|nr:hypothetical protein [Candidatus Binatia bacterium]